MTEQMKVTRVHDEIVVEGGTEQEHQTLLEQEGRRLAAEAERFAGYFRGASKAERFALYFRGASIKNVPILSEQQARLLREEWQLLRWCQIALREQIIQRMTPSPTHIKLET